MKSSELVHLALADGLRDGIFHAALLDAVIDDLRQIIRQRQVGIRLHEQQGNGEQDQQKCRVLGILTNLIIVVCS